MDGKIAVVTGGGQGLGRAIAEGLSRAGYRVAVLGRTLSKLEETCARMTGEGLALAVDLTDPDGVRDAFARIAARWGGCDVLVNNAATYLPFMLGEATDRDIRLTIDGTFTSACYCIREAIPRMTAAGGGTIVSISSENVHMPAPFLSVYAAAKSALVTLHHGLRNELHGTGIRSMIFETGRITESSVGEHWSPAMIERFQRIYEDRGYRLMIAEHGVEPETLAATVIHMIQAPPHATLETVRMRADQ